MIASDSWSRATFGGRCVQYLFTFFDKDSNIHASHHWLWSVVMIACVYQDLTFQWAAAIPHLFLVLERLLSQLWVRRNWAPKHYSPLCPWDSLHPSFATMQGPYQTTGRLGLHGICAASGEVSPQHMACR